MKKTFRYLLLLGALTGFASCLDEVPYGTYSNETFYNTEADAESALMYAYVPINYIDYCGRFLFFLSDVPTNQYKSYGKADESPLFQWDITPTSDEAIYFFKSAYVSLARTNSVLENVSRMTSISLSRSMKRYSSSASTCLRKALSISPTACEMRARTSRASGVFALFSSLARASSRRSVVGR